MASNNNGNRSTNSGNDSNMSSISTPTNDSLSSPRLINDSPRRSARLSSNSPQIGSRSIMQSSIHRTVSGGISGSLSPKMNIRKKSSLNNVRGNLSNTVNQFLLNDDLNNDNGNNYTTTTSYNLPSDQSDDEEMEVNNHNNNNTTVQPASSRLATRAEVLSHFDKQTNGYKCKHCDKVNIVVNSYEYIYLYIYNGRDRINGCLTISSISLSVFVLSDCNFFQKIQLPILYKPYIQMCVREAKVK